MLSIQPIHSSIRLTSYSALAEPPPSASHLYPARIRRLGAHQHVLDEFLNPTPILPLLSRVLQTWSSAACQAPPPQSQVGWRRVGIRGIERRDSCRYGLLWEPVRWTIRAKFWFRKGYDVCGYGFRSKGGVLNAGIRGCSWISRSVLLGGLGSVLSIHRWWEEIVLASISAENMLCAVPSLARCNFSVCSP